MSRAEGPTAKNGERIAAADVADALTRAPITYADGATQVFTRDGRTTYTESGSPSSGEWGVDDQGQFWSFWPPTCASTSCQSVRRSPSTADRRSKDDIRRRPSELCQALRSRFGTLSDGR